MARANGNERWQQRAHQLKAYHKPKTAPRVINAQFFCKSDARPSRNQYSKNVKFKNQHRRDRRRHKTKTLEKKNTQNVLREECKIAKPFERIHKGIMITLHSTFILTAFVIYLSQSYVIFAFRRNFFHAQIFVLFSCVWVIFYFLSHFIIDFHLPHIKTEIYQWKMHKFVL